MVQERGRLTEIDTVTDISHECSTERTGEGRGNIGRDMEILRCTERSRESEQDRDRGEEETGSQGYKER